MLARAWSVILGELGTWPANSESVSASGGPESPARLGAGWPRGELAHRPGVGGQRPRPPRPVHPRSGWSQRRRSRRAAKFKGNNGQQKLPKGANSKSKIRPVLDNAVIDAPRVQSGSVRLSLLALRNQCAPTSQSIP